MKTYKVQLTVEHLEVMGGPGHCCGQLDEPGSIVVMLTLDEEDVEELQEWLSTIQEGENG